MVKVVKGNQTLLCVKATFLAQLFFCECNKIAILVLDSFVIVVDFVVVPYALSLSRYDDWIGDKRGDYRDDLCVMRSGTI